jgi:hypothetical protein
MANRQLRNQAWGWQWQPEEFEVFGNIRSIGCKLAEASGDGNIFPM